MASKKSQKREKKNKKRSSAKRTSSVKGGSCGCGKNLFFKPTMLGGFVDDGKHYIEQPSFAGGIHPPSYYQLNNYVADPQDPSILHDARLDPMPNTKLFGGKRRGEKKDKSSRKKGGKKSTYKKRKTIKGGVVSDAVASNLGSANFPNIGVNAISANGNVSGAVLGTHTLLGVPSTYQGVYPINSNTMVKHHLV